MAIPINPAQGPNPPQPIYRIAGQTYKVHAPGHPDHRNKHRSHDPSVILDLHSEDEPDTPDQHQNSEQEPENQDLPDQHLDEQA